MIILDNVYFAPFGRKFITGRLKFRKLLFCLIDWLVPNRRSWINLGRPKLEKSSTFGRGLSSSYTWNARERVDISKGRKFITWRTHTKTKLVQMTEEQIKKCDPKCKPPPKRRRNFATLSPSRVLQVLHNFTDTSGSPPWWNTPLS